MSVNFQKLYLFQIGVYFFVYFLVVIEHGCQLDDPAILVSPCKFQWIEFKIKNSNANQWYTGCKIFPFFFPNWLHLISAILIGWILENLRLSQIQPIKTAEIRCNQFGKRREKSYTLYTVLL